MYYPGDKVYALYHKPNKYDQELVQLRSLRLVPLTIVKRNLEGDYEVTGGNGESTFYSFGELIPGDEARSCLTDLVDFLVTEAGE